MPLRRVRFLNSGYCTQWAYLAGRPGGGLTRFYAVFVYLEHPVHGAALIDTGYSPFFFQATQPFPFRLYRWATPARLDPNKNARTILAAHGLPPDEVRTVFVSHFHGDHVAGLRHFPRARFVYRRDAHAALTAAGPWQQVHQAFLPALLPDDFAARGHGLAAADFVRGEGLLEDFRVHDYWGDGSLLLVDLPGHADGHTGYLLRTATEELFYIVDAAWDVEGLLRARPLPRLPQRIQHSYADYVTTRDKLRRLAERGGPPLLACHCPRTQPYVARA